MSSNSSYLFVPALKADSFFRLIETQGSDHRLPYTVIFDLEDSIIDINHDTDAYAIWMTGGTENITVVSSNFSTVDSYGFLLVGDDVYVSYSIITSGMACIKLNNIERFESTS